MSNSKGCLRYWDQCAVLTIDAAVALWCDVEPSALSELNFATSCMDAKRQILIEALTDKRLDYVDNGVRWSNGMIGKAGSLEELIQKDGLRIKKDSLRRLFLDMPGGERPAFLFDEARRERMPDGGDVAEMNANIALAVMAWMLSENRTAMKRGDKPNAAAIGDAVAVLAKTYFGEDLKGFESFHKRIGKALSTFDNEQKTVPPRPWSRK